MSVELTFQAVGIYCFFPKITVQNVSDSDSILDVMTQMAQQQTGFQFRPGASPSGTIMDAMYYNYTNSSVHPPNATMASDGPRSIENLVQGSGLSRIWQYYRSYVVADSTGAEFIIRNPTIGQPPFSTKSLADDVRIPEGTNLVRYRLVWRTVNIELTPEKAGVFNKASNSMELVG